MLTVILALIPQLHRDIIIKENLGKGSRQGDEETTMEENGESELTKLSTTPQVPQAMRRKPVRKKAQRGVPMAAKVVVLDMLRINPCD